MAPASARQKDKAARAQVRAYLARLSPGARKRLRQLQAVVRVAAPGATEAISYSIPAFRFEGRILVWCAAWKEHYSIYPVTGAIGREAKRRGYQTSKGTIRIPLTEEPPVTLVRRLVKARMADVRKAASARRG